MKFFLFLFFTNLIYSNNFLNLADEFLHMDITTLEIKLKFKHKLDPVTIQDILLAVNKFQRIKYPEFEIDKAIENAKQKEPEIVGFLKKVQSKNQNFVKELEKKNP